MSRVRLLFRPWVGLTALVVLFAGCASQPRPTGDFVVDEPFAVVSSRLEEFLVHRFDRSSTFWRGGLFVDTRRPSPTVLSIELRRDSDALPPFCFVDVYAEGNRTRISVREGNSSLLDGKNVTEAVSDFSQRENARAKS